MQWKTFLKIVSLFIIAGMCFYIFYPKYKYKLEYTRAWRVNKYTSKVEEYNKTTQKWETYKER